MASLPMVASGGGNSIVTYSLTGTSGGLQTYTVDKAANGIDANKTLKYAEVTIYASGTYFTFWGTFDTSKYLFTSSGNQATRGQADMAYPATSSNRMGVSESGNTCIFEFYETGSTSATRLQDIVLVFGE